MIPALIFWVQAGGADTAVQGMSMLISALVGIGSSVALGGLKKATGVADTAIWNAVGKKAQPILIAGLTVALPFLGNVIGITDFPPADIVAQAPTASFIGIAARELALLLVKKARKP